MEILHVLYRQSEVSTSWISNLRVSWLSSIGKRALATWMDISACLRSLITLWRRDFNMGIELLLIGPNLGYSSTPYKKRGFEAGQPRDVMDLSLLWSVRILSSKITRHGQHDGRLIYLLKANFDETFNMKTGSARDIRNKAFVQQIFRAGDVKEMGIIDPKASSLPRFASSRGLRRGFFPCTMIMIFLRQSPNFPIRLKIRPSVQVSDRFL